MKKKTKTPVPVESKKKITFTVEFPDRSTRVVGENDVNQFIRSEKRKYRVKNAAGKVIFIKSCNG